MQYQLNQDPTMAFKNILQSIGVVEKDDEESNEH